MWMMMMKTVMITIMITMMIAGINRINNDENDSF